MMQFPGAPVIALPPGGQGQSVPGEGHRITRSQFLGQVQGLLVQDRGRLEVPEKDVQVRQVDDDKGKTRCCDSRSDPFPVLVLAPGPFRAGIFSWLHMQKGWPELRNRTSSRLADSREAGN
jgi:hypothetical protein